MLRLPQREKVSRQAEIPQGLGNVKTVVQHGNERVSMRLCLPAFFRLAGRPVPVSSGSGDIISILGAPRLDLPPPDCLKPPRPAPATFIWPDMALRRGASRLSVLLNGISRMALAEGGPVAQSSAQHHALPTLVSLRSLWTPTAQPAGLGATAAAPALGSGCRRFNSGGVAAQQAAAQPAAEEQHEEEESLEQIRARIFGTHIGAGLEVPAVSVPASPHAWRSGCRLHPFPSLGLCCLS